MDGHLVFIGTEGNRGKVMVAWAPVGGIHSLVESVQLSQSEKVRVLYWMRCAKDHHEKVLAQLSPFKVAGYWHKRTRPVRDLMRQCVTSC